MLVPGIRVIAVSVRPEAEAEALAEGADTFLSKAETPERILEIIEKLDEVEEE